MVADERSSSFSAFTGTSGSCSTLRIHNSTSQTDDGGDGGGADSESGTSSFDGKRKRGDLLQAGAGEGKSSDDIDEWTPRLEAERS